MEAIGSCTIIYDTDVPTLAFPWGQIHLLCEPLLTGGQTMTFGTVRVEPGTGHSRHNHPNADEIIYVIEGEALQMLDDQPPVPIRPGACIYIPRGVYHSTQNTGKDVLHLIVIYAPAGEEQVLRALPEVTLLNATS